MFKPASANQFAGKTVVESKTAPAAQATAPSTSAPMFQLANSNSFAGKAIFGSGTASTQPKIEEPKVV